MARNAFRSAVRCLARVALCLGALGVWAGAWAGLRPLPVDRAAFLLSDASAPPAVTQAWVDVALPDNWSGTRRQAEGIGWYRIAFDVADPAGEPLAVLIRRLSMNGEIFLNGTRLFSGGRMSPPVTHNWNVPFFVELPSALLRPGRNDLHVRVFAFRNSNGGLGRVWIGPADALHQDYLGVQAVHTKGAVVSFSVAVLAAFIGIAGWWRMGHDPLYGLFGLAMTCWAVRYTNYFVQDVPFDKVAYSLVVNSAQGWFFVFFTPFLLHLAGLQRRWVLPVLAAMGAVGTLSIWGAFQGWVPLRAVIGLWSFVWVPGALVLLGVSSRLAWKERSPRSTMAAVVVWLYVPLTLRELLITSNVMPFDDSYVAHYVGIPLALLIAWMLVQRAVDSGRLAAHAIIARERATFDERQRLTQDMHDGLGLQLNAALRAVESSDEARRDVAGVLRACLDELRLIVDASSNEEGDLLPRLATLRMRLQPRLEAAGLRVEWRMEEFPPQFRLPLEATIQVLRIVQEALNNVLKHAQARRIQISARATPQAVVLEVRDDGRGFDTAAATIGRGLGGMQRRAMKAGVGLQIESSEGGTCVRITLPLTAGQPQ